MTTQQKLGIREQALALAGSLIASVAAIVWSWNHRAFLLYGDAEAHTHIARRLFDSHRPGLTQLGSVWLPLPHLLMVPFVAVDAWWQSGFAGVIPSAACYLLSCIGLYKLARKWLSRLPASVALVFFAANPNLLYLQTTAMTEPLFLCELVWAVLLLVEWHSSLDSDETRSTPLMWSVIAVLVAAVFTRYDGWILTFLAWAAMAVCLWRRGRMLRIGFVSASVVLLLAPAGWMIYNAEVFGDWLDFMRGPYSAKAIELKTSASAIAPHPGWHNPWVSAIYFEKAAAMDAVAAGRWGDLLFFVAIAGTAWAWFSQKTCRYQPATAPSGQQRNSVAWTLFFWFPLPFYAYSVAWGSVPIFLPVWVPYSWYNTRYGMEMLPGFALFVGFAFAALLIQVRSRWPKWERAVVILLFVALAANVAEMLREQPLTYVEGKKNTASRGYYNTVIPRILAGLHRVNPQALVLMDTSPFPSFIPHAGMTYRETLNESDKEFYQAALAAPAEHADIVLAFTGDEVDKAVQAYPQHLRVYRKLSSKWQPDVTIYVSDKLALRLREVLPEASPTTVPVTGTDTAAGEAAPAVPSR